MASATVDTPSEITPATSSPTESCSIQEKFKDAVDWDEFKSRMMMQVMHSHAGKAPLDYYFADLAVTAWMENFDKSPEEFEEFIRSTPVLAKPSSEEGFISVLDTAKEEETVESVSPVKTYKEALLTGIPKEDEHSGAVSSDSKEA